MLPAALPWQHRGHRGSGPARPTSAPPAREPATALPGRTLAQALLTAVGEAAHRAGRHPHASAVRGTGDRPVPRASSMVARRQAWVLPWTGSGGLGAVVPRTDGTSPDRRGWTRTRTRVSSRRRRRSGRRPLDPALRRRCVGHRRRRRTHGRRARPGGGPARPRPSGAERHVRPADRQFPHRLPRPLVRRNGRLAESDRDTAMNPVERSGFSAAPRWAGREAGPRVRDRGGTS